MFEVPDILGWLGFGNQAAGQAVVRNGPMTEADLGATISLGTLGYSYQQIFGTPPQSATQVSNQAAGQALLATAPYTEGDIGALVTAAHDRGNPFAMTVPELAGAASKAVGDTVHGLLVPLAIGGVGMVWLVAASSRRR